MLIYKKMRIDRILVDRDLAATRSRAADLIRFGKVSVDGVTALKPGALLAPDASLSKKSAGVSPFVSRGWIKLAAALDAFGLDPKASSRSISAPRPVALPRFCSSAGRHKSLPWMSAATSYTPSSAAIRALWRLERTDAQGPSTPGSSRAPSAPSSPM